MRRLVLSIALGAASCGAPGREPEPARAELTRASELPARHRELLAAYGRGGEDWERARAAALEDAELERFLIDNLVIELVRAWSSMAGAAAPRGRVAFERAQGELVRLGSRSVPVLAALLEAPDGVVGQLAERTLERIGRDAVVPVAGLLASPQRDARRRAAELLERLPHAAAGEARAQAELARTLALDPEWIVRAQAALALGARGARDRDGEPARRALEGALQDADPAVASSAADGLATLADPLALPALIAALERAQSTGDLRQVRALEGAFSACSGDARARDLDGWRAWWYEHRDALLRARRGG